MLMIKGEVMESIECSFVIFLIQHSIGLTNFIIDYLKSDFLKASGDTSWNVWDISPDLHNARSRQHRSINFLIS
jgi:hypothetical protein